MAVGFDLYCQLLKQAVAQLKGQKPRLRLDVDVRLDFVVTNEAEFIAPPTKPKGFPVPNPPGVGKAPLPERIPAFIPVAYVSDPAMNAARAYHTTTLLPDGRILVAGGHANGSFFADQLSTAELYSP